MLSIENHHGQSPLMLETIQKENQKILLGYGAIRQLPKEISNFGAKNILLVTSDDSFRESGAQQAIKDLHIEVKLVCFDSFSVNPKIEDALGACELFRQSKIDLIIAIGGGSSIDMAKIINVIQTDPKNAALLATGKNTPEAPLLPLIAIPTTAGTGSESTHFAVVYVNEKKYSLAHENVLPGLAILDPTFTLSAPPYLMASTGFDALSQAVESLWASAATESSRALSRIAITLVLDNLASAIVRPDDKEFRLNLMKAANLAGQAINVSKTTAPHAISYSLTSYFNVPHGHAVALTLGKFFKLNMDVASLISDEEEKRRIVSTLEEYPPLFKVDSVEQCGAFWYEYMHRCGLETSMEKMGVISSKDIDLIIKNVNLERLQNHPVAISKSQIEGLFVS
jgi:alcohol dehydrogenase